MGSRLTGHLEGELGKGGVNNVYLITRRDTPAQAFYGKHGYKVSAEDIVMAHGW